MKLITSCNCLESGSGVLGKAHVGWVTGQQLVGRTQYPELIHHNDESKRLLPRNEVFSELVLKSNLEGGFHDAAFCCQDSSRVMEY